MINNIKITTLPEEQYPTLSGYTVVSEGNTTYKVNMFNLKNFINTGATITIYTQDSKLTGNRVVGQTGHTLTFTDNGNANSKFIISEKFEQGDNNTASGIYSHAEGEDTNSNGYASHSEGYNTTSDGNNSHAEGDETNSIGYASHAEGNNTTASGDYSHAEGSGTTANADWSHVEGERTEATDIFAHAEGHRTHANGKHSHAEGFTTTTAGQYSHSEGNITTASGKASHSEGEQTVASGVSSHSEGYNTAALDDYSHAEGYGTTSSGYGSHSEGIGTVAEHDYEHVSGKYNTVGVRPSNTLFVVGNGTNNSNRSDIMIVDTTGVTINGILVANEYHNTIINTATITSSGSTQFGDTTNDTHKFIGNVNITGKTTTDDLVVISGITGYTLDIMDDATVGGSLYVNGTITGNTITGGTFYGNGSGLTHLPIGVIGTTLFSNSATVNTSGFSQTNGVFIGDQSGMDSLGADSSVFIGDHAGLNATGNTHKSNFIGYYAGRGAHGAYHANFIGVNAGENAVDSKKSNFIGSHAGFNASGSTYSTFIGRYAGSGAHSSDNSIFLGYDSGINAHNSFSSVFIGNNAGYDANNSTTNIFIGDQSGQNATGVTSSVFIGDKSGWGSSDVNTSTFIGFQAGQHFLGNVLGSNNIIIGNNVSLPNGTSDSLTIGNVLFGTDLHGNTGGNPSIIPSNGKIGINVVNPSVELHVSGDAIISGDITGTTITVTQNGTGENILVGDNGFIGDINVNDTIQIKGKQDGTKGFTKFGTGGCIVGSTSRGAFNISGVPEHADNAAAILASLVSGDVYRTGDLLKIVY